MRPRLSRLFSALLAASLAAPGAAAAFDAAAYEAAVRECAALAADFTEAPVRPDWVLTENKVIDWDDDPTTTRQVRGLHARLPIKISATARYMTDDKRILLSECLLSSVSRFDIALAPEGAVPYGGDAGLDVDALEAASLSLADALTGREGYVDQTELSRKVEIFDPPFAAVHGCGDPAVLLRTYRYDKPGAMWTWAVSAVRRKAPDACAAR